MAKQANGRNVATLADLTPDPHNARLHSPRNVGMIESALGEVGAARSIVIDEDGVVLAGNATIEAAARAGIERVQVVDGDGETIIAVRRSGLTPAQKTALALYDNRAAELSPGWDADVLAAIAEAGEVDLSAWWREEEWSDILAAAEGIPWDAPIVSAGAGAADAARTATIGDHQADVLDTLLNANIKKFEVLVTMSEYPDTRARLDQLIAGGLALNYGEAWLYALRNCAAAEPEQ